MKPAHSLLSKIPLYIFMAGMVIPTGIFFSCHQKPKAVSTSAEMHASDSTGKKFTADMVDNKKDPSCGMPLSAGIEDTLHYNGKVYGFCSDECKQIFLKDPKTLAKNAEMKN